MPSGEPVLDRLRAHWFRGSWAGEWQDAWLQRFRGWSRETINQETISVIPGKDLDSGCRGCEKWWHLDIFQQGAQEGLLTNRTDEGKKERNQGWRYGLFCLFYLFPQFLAPKPRRLSCHSDGKDCRRKCSEKIWVHMLCVKCLLGPYMERCQIGN